MDSSAPCMPDPRPDPLVPVDCDLQDFPFMPLHVARLRDSDLATTAEPEACWYAVLLWAASWHQLPAGSLPDNDVVLTRFCGLGRDVATFRAHRAEALRGFVSCSDGRLYHPVVAEQVIAAWTGKLKQRWATECARIKKANQRHGRNDVFPTFAAFCAPGYAGPERQAAPGPGGVPGDVPSDREGTSPERPPGNDIQEKGTGTETMGEADASPSNAQARVERREFLDEEFAAVRELYGELVIRGRGSPMQARSAWLRLEPSDRRAMAGAVRQFAAAKPWGSSGPPALQRFIGDDIWREFVSSASVTSIVWGGPVELRAAVAAEAGEAFTRSYLDPSTWSADPRQPTIVALTAAAANRLRPIKALADVAIQDPILPRRLA